MARITGQQDRQGFAFATKVYDHHQDEFRRFLKYGTPGPKLVDLGQDVAGRAFPPFSLASSRGAKHALKCFKMVGAWKRDIPYMAMSLTETVYTLAEKARESRSRVLARALADLILTRAAIRRMPEVLFCFESIQVGLKALTGEKVSLATVPALLKLICAPGSPLSVTLGKRGGFGKATKVYVTLPDHSAEITILAAKHARQVDDWLLERGQWVVRVMQHEALLRSTSDERKAEYITSLSHIAEQVEEYLKQHSKAIPSSRLVQVDLPGVDLFNSVRGGRDEARAAPYGLAILTSDSVSPETPAELVEEEKPPQPAGTLFAPTGREQVGYFWSLVAELDQKMAEVWG